MKFKVVGKSLILTDYSHKIIKGENSFDAVEITIPRYHDNCDLSTLSFRFSEVSEDGETSAVQVLRQEKCDESHVNLYGEITSDFSAITGNITFMLTGINGENIVAKFQSDLFTVSDDISLVSLPNETTAEQIYNQTHLEAVRAAEAADRAEKFSKTPAPAEIYPASETNLGGVKVDGKTITASKDGTISVSDEIFNIANLSVQIAHPNNFLIYDNAGKPSVMVAIPKFYLDEVIEGASHTVHPAFIINGVEQNVIYISKYQNIVENGRAYSLPMKNPQTNITFDQAYNYCKAKGAGWHLMTNAEWAAIALWCKKNGTMPKGNNNYGKDISETDSLQKAVPATYDSNGKINKILTGSGGESWYHDETFAGIADLNGNIWEFCSGLRLVNGEIQILANNDAADWTNSCASDSTKWKAIMPDGSLVESNSTGTLKYKGNVISTDTGATGSNPFESITAAAGVTIPEVLKYLALAPNGTGYDGDNVWITAEGERMLSRGGDWGYGRRCGIFASYFNNLRSYSGAFVGFRSCYYNPA